ncbi:hypothetical protein Tco_1426212 [Tanacetum coccineum]
MSLGNQRNIDTDANPFIKPTLLDWNQDEVIVIPSDDYESGVNKPIPAPVEDADVEFSSISPDIVFEVIVIPSDDDESGANEPIPAPVEDVDVEIAPHPNHFFNPHLLNWNWDDVIVIPSDDDEPDAKEEISTPVNVLGRKRVYALIDESDSDDEPYRSNAFLF